MQVTVLFKKEFLFCLTPVPFLKCFCLSLYYDSCRYICGRGVLQDPWNEEMSFLEYKECGSTFSKLGKYRNLMFLLLKWQLIIMPKYHLQHQVLVVSWKAQYVGPRSWIGIIFSVSLSRTDLGLESYQVHKPSLLSPDRGTLRSPI